MKRLVKTNSYDLNQLLISKIAFIFLRMPTDDLLVSLLWNENGERGIGGLDFYLKDLSNINYLPLSIQYKFQHSYFWSDNQWIDLHRMTDSSDSFVHYQETSVNSIYFQEQLIKYSVPYPEAAQKSIHLNDIIYDIPDKGDICCENASVLSDKLLFFIKYGDTNAYPVNYVPLADENHIAGYFDENKKFTEIKSIKTKEAESIESVYAVFLDKLIYLQNKHVYDLNGNLICNKEYHDIYDLGHYLVGKNDGQIVVYDSQFHIIDSIRFNGTMMKIGYEKMYLLNESNIIDCYQVMDINLDNYLKYPIWLKEEIIKLLWINRKHRNVFPKELLNLIFYYLI